MVTATNVAGTAFAGITVQQASSPLLTSPASSSLSQSNADHTPTADNGFDQQSAAAVHQSQQHTGTVLDV